MCIIVENNRIMKSTKMLKLIAIIFAVAGIIFTGCKKNRTNDVANPDTTSLQQLSKDDAQVQASDDEITNDANAVLSSSKLSNSKGMDTTISSCTIKVDTVGGGDTLQITLFYNGFNTGHNFTRTGTVVLTKPLNLHWKDAGCTVTYKYLSLAVTKVSTGKTFIFIGTRTWTNVSGGLIMNLNGSSATVIHTINGSLTITFDDGSQRLWTISRQRVWGGTFPIALTVTVSGFGSNSGYGNLVEYGTNRKGEAFFTQINTPIQYTYNTCISYQWVPIWGQIVYQIPSVPKNATLTFGYNSSDALIVQGTCADDYRLDWDIKGTTGTIYLSLP
jgi:hypothetical protein